MSASNDELLLYEAARDGDLEEVKELLSKGTGTGYRNGVSYLLYIVIQVIFIIIDNSVVVVVADDDDGYMCY
jgi:hypothetical protein